MTEEEMQWETEGGASIVEITQREQRQYEDGPQGNQYALSDGQKVAR